jgi:hypothetical protein
LSLGEAGDGLQSSANWEKSAKVLVAELVYEITDATIDSVTRE